LIRTRALYGSAVMAPGLFIGPCGARAADIFQAE
jgi:hypothetical protein